MDLMSLSILILTILPPVSLYPNVWDPYLFQDCRARAPSTPCRPPRSPRPGPSQFGNLLVFPLTLLSWNQYINTYSSYFAYITFLVVLLVPATVTVPHGHLAHRKCCLLASQPEVSCINVKLTTLCQHTCFAPPSPSPRH